MFSEILIEIHAFSFNMFKKIHLDIFDPKNS